MSLSGATTTGESGLGSNGKEEVFRIPESFSITGVSPSDYLVSYPEHSLGVEVYRSAEMLSVYSPEMLSVYSRWGILTPLQRCSWCILQPQPIGRGLLKKFLTITTPFRHTDEIYSAKYHITTV